MDFKKSSKASFSSRVVTKKDDVVAQDDDFDDFEDDYEEPVQKQPQNLVPNQSTQQPKEEDEFADELDDKDDDFKDDFGDDYGSQTVMDKHNDLLKGLSDFKIYLRTLYNNWRGIYWDEESKCYKIDKTTEPIMNKVGADWCISFIKTYVRNNNILAHLSKEEYEWINKDINNTLMLSFAQRYEEFGMKHSSDIIRVWNEVENASLIALSGAGGGKYSGFLGGIVKYGATDNINNNPHQQPQQPKGFMGKLRGWLGGQK